MTQVNLGPKPFLMPQPAALVGTMVDGQANFMVAAWCGMANHTPPMVTVAVRPGRHTQKGIEAQGAFSLCVPPAGLAERADYAGIVSGAKRDKSGLFTVFHGLSDNVPLIAECRLNLECELVRTVELPTHLLHIAEIKATFADEACLEKGVPNMGLVDPLIYSMGDGNYWKVKETVGRAFSLGKALKD